ncbi:MAG: polya polymerase [Bacillota bacterium]|nr:polya polymerase [Bacillota bacterium]
MKISNIKDPQKFFDVVGKCAGRVEMVTGEGDCLNMKSKQCQFIALTQMFRNAAIDNVGIIVSEPSDINLLLEFMLTV